MFFSNFTLKVFTSLFSKSDRAPRAAPLVARRNERNLPNAVLFGSFSCGYIAKKKNGENFLNVTHPNPLPTFFFDTAGAKKKVPKKETPKIFRACGRDLGRCRLSFRCWTSQKSSIRVAWETLESMRTFTRHFAFLEKATQKLSSIFGVEKRTEKLVLCPFYFRRYGYRSLRRRLRQRRISGSFCTRRT